MMSATVNQGSNHLATYRKRRADEEMAIPLLFNKPITQKKQAIAEQQQQQEDIAMGFTSIATKIFGRWAMLNTINYSSMSAFFITNFSNAIPEIMIIGTLTRAFFEFCVTTHQFRLAQKLSAMSALALILTRKAKTEKEHTFLANVSHQFFNKKVAKKCVKTGVKLATVYTAWSIATYSFKLLLALTAIAACWQAVLAFVGVAIVTATAMTAINYLLDKKDNYVQNSVVRGSAESVAWTAVERPKLYHTVGTAGDCLIVSAVVSLTYAVSGILHGRNKQINFTQDDVLNLFKNWKAEQFSTKNIKRTLSRFLETKGYKTMWHRLTGAYDYAMRTAMKTVKLHLVKIHLSGDENISAKQVDNVCRSRRHWFDFFSTPKTARLFNEMKDGNSSHKNEIDRQLAQQATHFATNDVIPEDAARLA